MNILYTQYSFSIYTQVYDITRFQPTYEVHYFSCNGYYLKWYGVKNVSNLADTRAIGLSRIR